MVGLSDHAMKTYRYLRIAIVAMVIALLISIWFEFRAANELLSAISTYYYTPVNPLFVGSLIMIGICLIAIRGSTVFEEVFLNLSGMLAPVVALVPTSFPASSYQGELYHIPIEALTGNTIPSIVLAAIVAVFITVLLAARSQGQALKPAPAGPTVWIGLAVAVAGAAALLAVYQIVGSQAAHNTAAVGMFVGLWAVATASAVRHVQVDGRRSARLAWCAGIGGTLAVLGIVLAVGGVWRAAAGATLAWIFLAGVVLVIVAIVVPCLRDGARAYFEVLRGDEPYCRRYLLIALWMVAAGPLVGLVPGEFPQRAFLLEIAELVPFGIFWIVQTIERWDDGVVTMEFPEPVPAS